MAIFNGTADQIENNVNKVAEITKANTNETNYPSTAAVVKAISEIDIPEVDLSGKMDKFGEVINNEDNTATVINIETSNFSLKQTNENYIEFDSGSLNISGQNGVNFKSAPTFEKGAYLVMPQSVGNADVVNKGYVDDLVSNAREELSAERIYDPESTNAQSGIAVAEAVNDFGSNLKTINNQSLIGSGNIVISGGGSVVVNQTEDKITPLFIPIIPDFNWVSIREIAAFSANNEKFADGTKDGNNAYFKVTGNAGDNFVTIVSGGNAEMSDLTTAEQSTVWGAVLKYDNGHYVPCNAQYKDANSFYVYPALTEDITDGELGNIQVGIHLTKRGYIAYAQHAFNANPKHCEKNKYIAKYRPVAGESAPFTTFGGRTYTSVGKVNVMEEIQNKYAYAVWAMSMQWENSFHTTPSGMTWQVETNGENGYVEVYVGANPLVADPMGDLLDGEEIYVEIWLDGVLSQQYVKKSTYCERVCLDFAGATIAELKVYSNTWNRYKYGFNIGAVTWWVNERYLDSNTNPFKFKAITQLFDSWGVFQNEAVKTELERLNKELSGVFVPITNNSKGSQTSVWGRAYFYEKVQKTNPTVMITDFGINDANSIPYSQLPETITGPDGSVYDNNLTSDIYAQSMVDLINMAIANNIQPIVFGIGWRSGNGNATLPSWYMSTIDLWAKEI